MLWALLMAGGSGTRFWPESRAHLPKQFLYIFGKKTLLEQTSARIVPLIPAPLQLVMTHQSHTGHVKKLLKFPPSQIIGEPAGRNTAPCATLAAAMVLKKDPDAVLAILPSDHRIENEPLFRKALGTAARAAQKTGMPVTFGIKPHFAHTGYGYLENGELFCESRGLKIHKLKSFHEKPDLTRAEKFLRAGRFFWNSGMFVWRADCLLEAAKKYLPEVHKRVMRIVGLRRKGDSPQKRGQSPLQRFYPAMPNISIDYGLMEKMKGKILTIPVDIGWHDLGSWQAFESLWAKDKSNNATHGSVIALESSGNIVKSGRRLITLLGVHDLVVVDTEDAILVCPKKHTESIRKVVEALKSKKLKKYL